MDIFVPNLGFGRGLHKKSTILKRNTNHIGLMPLRAIIWNRFVAFFKKKEKKEEMVRTTTTHLKGCEKKKASGSPAV